MGRFIKVEMLKALSSSRTDSKGKRTEGFDIKVGNGVTQWISKEEFDKNHISISESNTLDQRQIKEIVKTISRRANVELINSVMIDTISKEKAEEIEKKIKEKMGDTQEHADKLAALIKGMNDPENVSLKEMIEGMKSLSTMTDGIKEMESLTTLKGEKCSCGKHDNECDSKGTLGDFIKFIKSL